jgi:hypothetical protein
MAFITPYTTDKFISYLADESISRLSLAVWLTDEYTQSKPLYNVNVLIKEGNIYPSKNPSGYYLFNDLPDGNYNLIIESEAYFYKNALITLPRPDLKNPSVEVILKPRPSYLFPDNSTLVRGMLSNTGPIAEASVKVTGKAIETTTDERGEFALYFKGIKKEDIVIEFKKNGNSRTVNTTIEEGKTASLGIITFP